MVLQIVLLVAQLTLVLSQQPVVQTEYGKLKGEVHEFDGKQFTSFLGVPYAAPPEGELRFEAPQKHGGWGDSIRDALERGPGCAQDPNIVWEDVMFPPRLTRFPISEDCLFLNIYVPGDVSNMQTSSLPVVVFIHGGGFILGSSWMHIGDMFVTDAEPVILVAIEYRLNIFGFLTAGDDVMSANNGLKDQSFALKWVRDNIAQFGGAPDQVTIVGHSSGGESVMAHMISPMSAGLFHKACAQSAPTFWLYPTREDIAYHFRDFVAAVNCAGDTREAVECLKTKPWEQLSEAATGLDPMLVSQRVIDGEFIPDEPRKLWASGQINDAELMVGFTSDDGKVVTDYFTAIGADFVADRSQDLEVLGTSTNTSLKLLLSDDKSFSPVGPTTRYGNLLTNRDDLYTVVKARYYDARMGALEKARGILDIPRDAFYMAISLWSADQLARRGKNVYFYVFDHASDALGLNEPGEVSAGAPHGGELAYEFGYGFTDSDTVDMSPNELLLTRSMIQAWTSFASGNQATYLTMDGEELVWTKYTPTDGRILVFDTNMAADSVHNAQDWQAIRDFWVAIDGLAQWEDDEQNTEAPFPPVAGVGGLLSSMYMITSAISMVVLIKG